MGSLSPWHWAILIVVLVLLFGAKKLPDAARSVGRSLKILKAETKGLREDDDSASGSSDIDADMKQLPKKASTAEETDDDKVAELQRQLDELKQQSDQPHKNAS